MLELNTTFVQEVADLRKKVIWDGKHSKKFRSIPKKYLEAQPDKYGDLENLDNSGAINELDAMILYHLVRHFKPENIFEIGTWFGTSAQVMLLAQKSSIYTCDKNNYFVAQSQFIHFMNTESWNAIKKFGRIGYPIDLIFTDGALYGNDPKRLSKLCRRKIFITHDYVGKEKGYRNVRKMKKLWPGAVFIPPVEGSTIAVLYEE